MDQKVTHNGSFTDPGVKNAEPKAVGALNVGGVIVQPGATANIPNWERAQRSNAVRSWLNIGILSLVESKASKDDDDGDDSEAAEKAELIAKLDALGIKKTARTSLDNLKTALAEAEAAEKPVASLPGLPQ
jgi:hypothetical protein